MSLGTNNGFETAAASPAYGELVLVEMQFRSGTVRLTNWPVDVPALGQNWVGVGSMGGVGDLHESEDGAEEKVELGLSAADEGVRALALRNPSDYQERRVRIWIALLDAQSLQPSGDPVLRFVGVMDKPSIDDAKGAVTMQCRTASYDVRSNPSALRYSHAQHQLDHPGEKGFEYVEKLLADTTVWLSAAFQRSRG